VKQPATSLRFSRTIGARVAAGALLGALVIGAVVARPALGASGQDSPVSLTSTRPSKASHRIPAIVVDGERRMRVLVETSGGNASDTSNSEGRGAGSASPTPLLSGHIRAEGERTSSVASASDDVALGRGAHASHIVIPKGSKRSPATRHADAAVAQGVADDMLMSSRDKLASVLNAIRTHAPPAMTDVHHVTVWPTQGLCRLPTGAAKPRGRRTAHNRRSTTQTAGRGRDAGVGRIACGPEARRGGISRPLRARRAMLVNRAGAAKTGVIGGHYIHERLHHGPPAIRGLSEVAGALPWPGAC